MIAFLVQGEKLVTWFKQVIPWDTPDSRH